MSANNFNKILVPLDGSKYSKKALERACKFTLSFDSKLVLMYVVEKSMPLNFLDRKEYLKILKNFGNKVLDESKSSVLKKGITARTMLKEGNIVDEIEKVAEKEQCDLIIVGNKGLGSVTRFLLGSVSNKLAQSSRCSVMIVK